MNVIQNAFAKITEMRDAAANELKAKIRAHYAEKDQTVQLNAYLDKIEGLADNWKSAFANNNLTELQEFLKNYRQFLLESLVESTDPKAVIEARARVKIFDMLLNEPQKVIKEYETLAKASK